MEEKYSEAYYGSKRKHPYEEANIISNIFFCWQLPYFVKGFKKNLTEDDMYGPLRSHEANRLGDKLEEAWNYEVAHKKEPSLWLALIKVFRVQLVLLIIFFIILELLVKLSQPLLISKFLEFYEPNQTEISKNDAYIYAGLIVVTVLLQVLGNHTYLLHTLHLAMKFRIAACSLIYRKALKLSRSSLEETTIGQMVNLLSNDVGRFDVATSHVHFYWLAPLETIIVMYLVYAHVGLTGLAGCGFLLLFVPFQMYLGKRSSQYRLKIALRTDERVRLMSEIITGIQVIKMYTWEKPFAKLVELARGKEMEQIRGTSVIRAIMMSCGLVLNRAAIYLCILTYIFTGNTINATYVYTISSFYGILRQVLTVSFPRAVTQFAETNVSVARIRKFLLYEEVLLEKRIGMKYQNVTNTMSPIIYEDQRIGVHLKNVSVKWASSIPENTLENVTFEINSNQLVAIVGPVGGGKTTLLQVILRELPPVRGTVEIVGSLSYASQEPWLFGGSVRQNILFGQEFIPKKYEEVVRVCALERDFTLFPYGDLTLVGDRGVTLSGGQRARINLARAVYKDANVYLLDDPLSAVDAHVGRQLYEECICGYLKNKCVILVTHQLQYLRNVQTIYLLQHGYIEASGTYSELQESKADFTKLLSNPDEEDMGERNGKSEELKEKVDTAEPQKDAPTQKREERASGSISRHVYKSYMKAGENVCTILFLAFVFITSQIAASVTDYFLNIWVNLEQWRSENNMANFNYTFPDVPKQWRSENNMTNFNDTFPDIPKQWRSENNMTNFNDTFPDILKDSSASGTLRSYLDGILTEDNSMIIYSCLILATTVVTITRSISFFRYCMTASTNLHNLMFDKIVYATMRFFNNNPPGRILNRFSKDIGIVDESLPLTILDTIQVGLIVLSISIIIGILNPWILLPTIAILIIFYFLRVIFLATSRDIKRVEATTRSPIYTHLSASLQGLTTIRAFGAQEILQKEFDNFQNQYSAPFFMFLAANRTFGFWLDFHCAIYITLVIISILFIEGEIFGGNVGLALTQSMTLIGMFQWGMRQWSELENNMTSVERVQEYTEVSPEPDETTKEPPKFWPEEGNIKFDNLCLRYSSEDSYVLKNLTFELKSEEKIGIVGRTGAGKSSLIAALFRLTDIDGRILIDNVDIKEIPLAVLRSKISIIPQEPVLFSGTLRKNLDPFDEYNDEVLWGALTEVELKSAVSELPAGLDSKISEGGSNFSVGQRQLLCLARAIIRNNKILILDEATANVDPQTDGLIQTTIRRKFANCTVLTIAHRLHTIMDSDKVLVMDAGKAVEFDEPYTLLKNPDGIFYKLVMQTGKAMADNLIAIAENNHKSL